MSLYIFVWVHFTRASPFLRDSIGQPQEKTCHVEEHLSIALL